MIRLKSRIVIVHWAFSYLELLLILATTIVIVTLSLPPWATLIAPILALVVRPAVDYQKARREPITKLATSVGRLIEEFAKFTGGAWGCSIRSIAQDFISKHGTSSEKIKGWAAYFDQGYGVPAQLFQNYVRFTQRWRKFNENPKGEEKLSGLTNEFLNLVGLHYQMHIRFLDMVTDMGNGQFEENYVGFKKEYDEFYRNLRGITADLKKVTSVEIENTFYYGLAKDFPKVNAN